MTEKVARVEVCAGCGLPIEAGLIRDAETGETYHFLCLATGARAEVDERDAWYVETQPTCEGIEELRKARRGEGLDAGEVLGALRAAMEVADAAKRRGKKAEAMLAEITQLREELGWQPLYDALREGQDIYDKFEAVRSDYSRGSRGEIQMELDRWCYRTFGPEGALSSEDATRPTGDKE